MTLNRPNASGNIAKTKSPADGRSFLVELTPLGIEVQHGAWKRFLQAQDAVVEQLDLPADDVSAALRRLTEGVRATTPC